MAKIKYKAKEFLGDKFFYSQGISFLPHHSKIWGMPSGLKRKSLW